MYNLVLKNQVVLGVVNAGPQAFDNAVRDIGVFAARWPQALRAMITGRYPMEAFHDPVMGKAGGIKNVIEISRDGPAVIAELARLAEDERREKNWKRWGPYLSERQWGTVREDYSAQRRLLGLFSARSRAQPRLPLGRRRPAGHLRPRVPPVLRAGPVERPRPHPEGAAVRADQPRRQPRRGRQGVLLLPGFHAHAFLHEGALQVSAGGLSVRPAGGRESPPRPRSSRSSNWRTPAFSTSSATSISSSNMPRPAPDDLSIRITAVNRGPERAHAARCCPRCGSAIPGRGGARAKATGRSRRSAARAIRRLLAEHASLGKYRLRSARRRRSCSSPKTKPTSSGCSASKTPAPYVKDAFHAYLIEGRADARESAG